MCIWFTPRSVQQFSSRASVCPSVCFSACLSSPIVCAQRPKVLEAEKELRGKDSSKSRSRGSRQDWFSDGRASSQLAAAVGNSAPSVGTLYLKQKRQVYGIMYFKKRTTGSYFVGSNIFFSWKHTICNQRGHFPLALAECDK